MADASQHVEDDVMSNAEQAVSPSAADPVTPADEDDLFGDAEDGIDQAEAGETGAAASTTPQRAGSDEDDEDEEDDEDDIRPSNRRRKRAVGSPSPAPASGTSGRSAQAPALPTFDDDEDNEMREASQDPEEAARIAALEYTEDGGPMGRADGRSPSPPVSKVVANIALAATAQRFTPSHLARLPLFLKLESGEFQPAQYIAHRKEAVEREPHGDDRTEEVERRLRCENTIRWRTDQDGVRQSNSRFVRWSDGSWTLQVGKEHFDIAGLDTRFAGSKNIQLDTNAATLAASQTAASSQSVAVSQNQNVGASQGVKVGASSSSKSKPNAGQSKPQGQPLSFIATPDADSELLQTLGPLYSNITMQPTSLHSATHRLISQNLSSSRAREGASKVTMSELAQGERAPEEVKRERERKLLDEERKKRLRKKKERGGDIEAEEEAELQGLLKGRRKTMIEEASKSSRSKGLGGPRRGGLGATGLSTALDEEEEEEDAGGYMEDDADGFIVNDEDAEGEEDDEGEDDDGDDDSEMEEGQQPRSSKKKSSSSAAGRMDIDDELDDMEKAEMEIERQEAARAKAKKAAAAAAPPTTATPEGASDGQSQRKKKTIIDSDDDEDE